MTGSKACTECSAGTYLATMGATSAGDCLSCPLDSYSPAGSSVCTCNVGYTGPDGEPCSACASGTYKNVTGSGACTTCPEHTSSPAGSIAEASCACNAGYTAAAGRGDDTCSTANDGECDEARYGDCAEDSVCNEGTDVTDCLKCALPCAACAAGTYKGDTGDCYPTHLVHAYELEHD